MHIHLEGETEVDPDGTREGYWTDGHRVAVRAGHSVSIYTLPKGNRRVTLTRLGNGRGQLVLGGFKAVTVTVTGPMATVATLREAVL